MRRVAIWVLFLTPLLSPGSAMAQKTGQCEKGKFCTWSCPEGGCVFECGAGSNCSAACEGGKCTHICQGGANCGFSCEGGGCARVCRLGSNCTVSCAKKKARKKTKAGKKKLAKCTTDCAPGAQCVARTGQKTRPIKPRKRKKPKVSTGRVCPKETKCDETCPLGQCVVRCTAGSECKASCAGGDCQHSCEAGATCSFGCTGGDCAQGCKAGSTCDLATVRNARLESHGRDEDLRSWK